MSAARIFRPPIRRGLGYLAGCALFAAIGGWMAWTGQTMGWFCLIVFGLGVLVLGVNLLPGSSFLQLADGGFVVRSLYREHSFRWSEVGPFRVQKVGVNAMVVFDFTGEYRRSPVLRRASVALAGCEGALPNTYGYRPEALAQIMNAARTEALAGDPG